VLAERGLGLEQAGFMGDDLVDLPVLTRCGFAVSVPGAPASVRSRAHLVTQAGGGRGAAREACEFILESQGRLDELVASFCR
ncbi:MAG: phenylphosphate carboxylase subunit delta, partial [Candidatus Kapabacteria bacterium]|nr:phenylphosphate carboxylase subunit delta [Candidatus Kapabacteria bacterium]